jgi:hypothetical protein
MEYLGGRLVDEMLNAIEKKEGEIFLSREGGNIFSDIPRRWRRGEEKRRCRGSL